MKKGKKNISRILFYFICTVCALSVILTSLLLILQSSDYFANEAKTASIELAQKTAEAIANGTSAYDIGVENIADTVAGLHGFEAFDAFGKEAAKANGYLCLQFLHDGGADYRYGDGVGNFYASEIQSVIHSNQTARSAIFKDLSLGTSCIAIYTPVSGNDEVDGILAYMSAENIYSGLNALDERTKFYSLCEPNGSMLEEFASDDFEKNVSHNAFEYLKNICDNKEQYDNIFKTAEMRISGSGNLTVKGENYVVAQTPYVSGDCLLTVVCVYYEHDLISGSYPLYDSLLGAVVLLVGLTVMTIIIAVIQRIISNKKITIIDELDPILGCNTQNRFVQEAQIITEQNRFSKFAICYTTIKNYDYFGEKCSKELIEEMLMHISNVLAKSISKNETYGHIVDDHFVFMIHYTDINNLANKIKVIKALISYFDKIKAYGSVTILTGAFLTKENGVTDGIDNNNLDINDCINKAKIACLAHVKSMNKPFIIYDSSIGTIYTEDAAIESKMRGALENKEFRLFFQPKYNIKQRNIDSAEVLIRWYNKETETYQSPVSFIHIFETNGFIIDLDHYVFRETCTFLREMKSQGQATVPLSVNVSRVTAIESGFVEFYKEVKREFGIPDGYITLEFTETFAYDSYSTLSELVLQLKECGFLCSIDDFGVDCSALNILKELPVDEIKIDKQLIHTGHDSVKDRIILEGVFNMANQLGLKLIQEGVETKEELDYIHHLGCNIIQGYYYAKPLFMTDFIDFINDSALTKMLTS